MIRNSLVQIEDLFSQLKGNHTCFFAYKSEIQYFHGSDDFALLF